MAKKIKNDVPPDGQSTQKKTVRNSDGVKTGANKRTTAPDGERNAKQKVYSKPFTIRARTQAGGVKSAGKTFAKVGKVVAEYDPKESGGIKFKTKQKGGDYKDNVTARTAIGRFVRGIEGRIAARQVKKAYPAASVEYETYKKRDTAKAGVPRGAIVSDVTTTNKAGTKGTSIVEGKNKKGETQKSKVKVRTHIPFDDPSMSNKKKRPAPRI